MAGFVLTYTAVDMHCDVTPQSWCTLQCLTAQNEFI